MGVQAVHPPSSGSAPHSALVLPLHPDPWGLTRGPGGDDWSLPHSWSLP